MIKNKKILVFGSKGFIGSRFCEKISPKNIIIKPFFKKIKFNHIDLSNFYSKKINNLIKKNNFDYILNFHAHTDVKYSDFNSRYDFYHNCSLTHSIIDALIKNKSKAFFLNFGTVTQLGYTNIENKINQNYRGKPITIFDLHKQYNEDYISIYKKIYNLRATTLRLANVFGVGKAYSKNRGIINHIINKAYEDKIIYLYGSGNNIRDFIYIEDVIDGILSALINCDKLCKDYYYLTSGVGYSFNKFARSVCFELLKNFGYSVQIKYVKWPKEINLIDKRSFIGNPTSFKKITGWKPKYSLRNAINHYVMNNKFN